MAITKKVNTMIKKVLLVVIRNAIVLGTNLSFICTKYIKIDSSRDASWDGKWMDGYILLLTKMNTSFNVSKW